jgi:hypothetical protein
MEFSHEYGKVSDQPTISQARLLSSDIADMILWQRKE